MRRAIVMIRHKARKEHKDHKDVFCGLRPIPVGDAGPNQRAKRDQIALVSFVTLAVFVSKPLASAR